MSASRVAWVGFSLLLFACSERTRTRQVYDGGLDCAENERLRNGECTFVCDRDVDCPEGQRCDLLLGTCVARASKDDAGVRSFPCTTGATRCRADNKAVEACSEAGVWLDQQLCAADGFCLNEQCLACQPGLTRCDPARPTQLTVCLDDGSASRTVQCQIGGACVQGECRECAPNTSRCSPDGKNLQVCQKSADETLSWRWTHSGDNFDGTCISQQCVAGNPPSCKPPDCIPGATSCAGPATVQTCSAAGKWQAASCASQPGMGPNAECQNGVCFDECAEAVTQKSYFGCEYWTAVQDNSVDPAFKGGTTSGQGTADSDFAFALSNRSANPAVVKIYRWFNSAEQLVKTVNLDGRYAASKGLQVVKVPWQSIGTQAQLEGSVSGRARYGYRITSSKPITVYQFSPLDAVKRNFTLKTDEACSWLSPCLTYGFGSCVSSKCEYTIAELYSNTNDASLLLPAHILGTSHVVVSQPHIGFTANASQPPSRQMTGHVTIVGTQNATTVTFKSTARTTAGTGVAAMEKGGSQTFTLNRYDVLQLTTDHLGANYLSCASNPFPGTSQICRVDNDLTGSVVTSNKPVAVFGGAACSLVPYSVAACDHMEEQIFPFATWGKTFVAHRTHPVRLLNGQFASTTQAAPDYYKVVAGCPASTCPAGTRITFSTPPAAADVLPPNRCLTGTIATNDCQLAGGAFMEFRSKGSFTVSGDQPIALAQIFAGQDANTVAAKQGDPSLVLLPPAEQWRADYTVQTAPGIADNYLGIVIDDSKVQSVSVDGVALTGLTAIPLTTFKAINHPVSVGVHTVTVQAKPGQTRVPGAGVTVYGFDNYVSYGYTGGLDLGSIVVGIDPGG